ncbi:MAG: hypothetical protein EPN82_04860 [Bacteroidetes bacterium]|nr:MAG: hypothetical protein EPN82_04860 [Bacteroidota bacterium]
MLKKFFKSCLLLICFLATNVSYLFAEGKPATEINKTVKVEGLTGLNLFLAQTYNNNRLLFAVISTGTIVILGLIVTYIVSLFIKPSGHTSKKE